MDHMVEFQIDGEKLSQAIASADGFVAKKDDDLFARWTLIAEQGYDESEQDSVTMVCRNRSGCLEITMPAEVKQEGVVAVRSLQIKKIFKAATIAPDASIVFKPHKFKTTITEEVGEETVKRKVVKPALKIRGSGINMVVVLHEHSERAREEILEDAWVVDSYEFINSLRSVEYAKEQSAKTPHIAFRSIMVSVDGGAGYLAAGDGHCAAISGLPPLERIGNPASIQSLGMPVESVSGVVSVLRSMVPKDGRILFGISSDERVLMLSGEGFRLWVLPYVVEFSAIATMRSFLEGSRQGVQYVADRSEWLRIIQLMSRGIGADKITLYARDGDAMVEAYDDRGQVGTCPIRGASVSSDDIQPMKVSIARLKKAIEACSAGLIRVEVARSNEPVVVMSAAKGEENNVHVLWPYVQTEIDFTPEEEPPPAWEDPF